MNDSGTESTAGGSSEGRSWLENSSLRSVSGLDEFFSLPVTVGIALAVGAGILIGDMVLPAGRMIGIAAVAVAIGAFARKRRYAEVVAAGITIGGVSALFNHALLATGAGESMAAVGVTTGVLVSLTGYYVGRLCRSRLGIEAA